MNHSTTLMYAARYGHVDLVELLLELGHEEEVISVVIRSNSWKIFRVILTILFKKDNEGITVLMLAAMYSFEEVRVGLSFEKRIYLLI